MNGTIKFTKISKRNWQWNVLFIAILIGLFGYIYRSLFKWEMLALFDLTPWYYTPGELYIEFSSSWAHLWLGKINAIGPGDFMVQSILITLCGGNAAMAQRIFWLSILPLSAITMRILLGRFTTSNIARLIIPMVYAVNGVTIFWFQIGHYSLLPHFVVFPLLMLYLIKLLEEKERRLLNMLIFTLLYGLMTNWVIYALAYFLPFLVIFFLIEVLHRRDWKYTVKTSLLFVGSFGILFLLVAPVGFDQVVNIFGYYATPTGSFGLYGPFPIEYLLPTLKWAFSQEYAVIMVNYHTYLLGMFALGTLLVRHRTRLKHYFSLLLIATLINLFSRLVGMGLMISWLTYFPVFLTYLSPPKLNLITIWSFFLMMAILVSEVEERIALRHKAIS